MRLKILILSLVEFNDRKKVTTEELISRAKLVHGNKYCYDDVVYINAKTKIKISCNEHGIFEQNPYDHLSGSGCQKCKTKNLIIRKTKSIVNFIKDANNIHNNKYNYDKFIYVHGKIKGIISCSIHGDFKQTPNVHLCGHGCRECSIIKIINTNKTNIKDFIYDSNLIHSNKYDYSLVKYINNHTKISIICAEHGTFKQTPNSHLSGQGCSKCGRKSMISKMSLTIEEFVRRANEKHNNKYNYSETNYINAKFKINIICPIHGMFEQRPFDHLNGCGCKKCIESNGESDVRNFLEKNNIKYIKEKIFDECKYKTALPFDFYLPKFNSLVEYDGIQHFEPVDYFGGINSLIIQQKRDQIKNKFAKENGYNLVRISYKENIEEKLSIFLE